MNAQIEIELLQEEIRKTLSLLDKQEAFRRDFMDGDFEKLGRTQTSAMVISELLINFYTCIETLFLKISQYFENSLNPDRWHTDLLEKMTLRIEGLREPVISGRTHMLLTELMKFRHFRRYYFEFEYDWDKLDFLTKKRLQAADRLEDDLKHFSAFLDDLKRESM